MSEQDLFRNRIIESGMIRAGDVLAHPNNPKIHPMAQRRAVRASLEEVGMVDRIMIFAHSRYLADGHERVWQALDSPQGEDTLLPYDLIDVPEDKEEDFLLYFDGTGMLAQIDEEVLQAHIDGTRTTGNEVLDELATELALRNGLQANDNGHSADDPGAQIDRAAELNEKWQVKRGDLWQIGAHRLLCGDSTNSQDVARLMGDEKAQLMVTDPPYNVTDNDWDKFNRDDFYEFLEAFLLQSGKFLSKRASLYICMNWRYVAELKVILDRNYNMLNWIIWHHESRGADFKFFTPSHQDILFYSCGKDYYFDASQIYEDYADTTINRIKYEGSPSSSYILKKDGKHPSDVWSFPFVRGNAHENEPHPTQKPIELVERCILASAKTDDIVYDPFGGSGTTMVACEQLSRQCRMMEISENYCAVILQRLTDMGLEATRITDPINVS